METLIKIVGNYTEADVLDETISFRNDLELSSFDTVCLVDEIEEAFGVRLQMKDFIAYKTLGEMAAYITSVQI